MGREADKVAIDGSKTKVAAKSSMGTNLGIRCPKCGCADFRDEEGRPWEVTNVVKIPGATRRYKNCRHCGHRVRTKETIEK